MFGSISHLSGWRSLVCGAALPLVLLATAGSMARPANSAAVETVDAFIAARVAGDSRTVAALLSADSSVVDTTNSIFVTGDEWDQLLPVNEVLEVGPRQLENNGDVTWSELVLDDGRPGWENNPNWFLDDNSAREAVPLSQHGLWASGLTRTMRA